MTTPYRQTTSTPSTCSSAHTGRPRPTVANDDFARERQLRDHRRAHGLCFKCGDRYSREHRCKQPTQLLTIQVGDHGEVLTDDAVHARNCWTNLFQRHRIKNAPCSRRTQFPGAMRRAQFVSVR